MARPGKVSRQDNMSSAASSVRELVTPEGVPLGIVIGSAASRFMALMIDFIIIGLLMLALFLLLLFAFGTFGGNAMKPIGIVIALSGFVLRNLYFLLLESRPKAATFGKRLLGLRVVSRDGGPLSIDQVVARNLMREVELFLPFMVLGSMAATGDAGGWAVLAGFVWALGFSLFLLFNKDRMRIGDLLAGTWVVERQKVKRVDDLAAGGTVHFDFTDAALDQYGITELHKLEDVLRSGDSQAQRTVADAIAQRIGYTGPIPDDRQFLTDYYRGLRAHLEREVLLGTRRQDKNDL